MSNPMTTPLANWNGEEMPLDQVRVSVLDRAFLFGDGVYEVLSIYRGKPFLLREHMDRFENSLRELRIACDLGRLEQRMQTTLRNSRVQEGMVYMQVTRGVAPRSHHFPNPPVTPNELIYIREFAGDPFAEYRESGCRLITYPDIRWKRCDIKSVNLLGNCLAAQAAAEAGCLEALLVADDGSVNEASHSSLFAVHAGEILTAPLAKNILPGITRSLVLKLAARCKIRVAERAVMASELHSLDELFLTGTTAEVLAITEIDGKPAGGGKPGPITQRLFHAYLEFVEEYVRG